MKIGEQSYEIGKFIGMTAHLTGTYKQVEKYADKMMDTAPVIKNDRTMVPLWAIGEALGKNVYYEDGYILISDLEQNTSDANIRLSVIKAAPVPAKIEVKPISQGKKFYPNQLDIYAVDASDNDGNIEAGAVDLEMGTRWSAHGPNTLTLDLGSVRTVSGVSIAMWKGHERIYPFSIEYSADEKTWTTALPKTQNSGETEDFEQYDFSSPVEARYIRYSGDGATDPKKNYCHISEIAVLGTK